MKKNKKKKKTFGVCIKTPRACAPLVVRAALLVSPSSLWKYGDCLKVLSRYSKQYKKKKKMLILSEQQCGSITTWGLFVSFFEKNVGMVQLPSVQAQEVYTYPGVFVRWGGVLLFEAVPGVAINLFFCFY